MRSIISKRQVSMMGSSSQTSSPSFLTTPHHTTTLFSTNAGSSSSSSSGHERSMYGIGFFGAVLVGSIAFTHEVYKQHRHEIFAAETSADDDQTTQQGGWRERMTANYNNRIRAWSSPEKIFETFASVTKDGDAYMTLEDFRDSLLPAAMSINGDSPITETPKVFQLADVDGDGLISFSEYLFFTTLLGIPKKHYKISFRMFDDNADGTLDIQEFVTVMKAMQEATPLGRQQRSSPFKDPRGVSSSSFDESSLLTVFFGEDGKGRLSYEQFAQFMHDLKQAVLKLEFDRYADDSGTISAQDFALAVIGYAQPKMVASYQKKISDFQTNDRITFKEFCSYQYVLQKLSEVAVALKLYGFTEGVITKKAFSHAVTAVTEHTLTPTQIDIIFHLFDEDGDGRLNFEELISVMRKRTMRGLKHEREVGLARWFSCVWKCSTKSGGY
eukprot:CAMPEP_0201553040 /NCGR_PEP_ID=MMETSP0173_2-20130828/19406_1 /ASSEMBLY_ACC=CAM_ASM_000268 /TAXON_ID=218659 /ORGANISM="Vexillifera sp., Strain DIVA3 564/2" /LENGTH=441 /DNA_ID=CAMNT_0047963641 /DNA_START=334 /DNA_END=1659 /DNA_ORIENTATION=-